MDMLIYIRTAIISSMMDVLFLLVWQQRQIIALQQTDFITDFLLFLQLKDLAAYDLDIIFMHWLIKKVKLIMCL